MPRAERDIPVPTEEACFTLIRETGMMKHIVAHSRQVCRVALFLTASLQGQGLVLDTDLVRTASLLHDITKTRSLQTGEDHARTGAELLAGRGYPEVGKIIGEHVRLSSYEDLRAPGEVQIVNYADKRVLHESITSLGERMAYILERYGRSPGDIQRIVDTWEKTKILEKCLFRYLPYSPDELAARMNGSVSPA